MKTMKTNVVFWDGLCARIAAPRSTTRSENRAGSAFRVCACLAIVLVFVACQRPAGGNKTSTTEMVAFEGTGVSIIPGQGWQKVDKRSFDGPVPPGVCLPTLVGKAGVIQVLLLPPETTDPRAAAAQLRTAFDADPESIRDSFRQEDITTASGTQFIHVASRQMANKQDDTPEGRSHSYIVKNRAGRVVSIGYLTVARMDSEEVHQMFQKTLKLE